MVMTMGDGGVHPYESEQTDQQSAAGGNEEGELVGWVEARVKELWLCEKEPPCCRMMIIGLCRLLSRQQQLWRL